MSQYSWTVGEERFFQIVNNETYKAWWINTTGYNKHRTSIAVFLHLALSWSVLLILSVSVSWIYLVACTTSLRGITLRCPTKVKRFTSSAFPQTAPFPDFFLSLSGSNLKSLSLPYTSSWPILNYSSNLLFSSVYHFQACIRSFPYCHHLQVLIPLWPEYCSNLPVLSVISLSSEHLFCILLPDSLS